MQKLSIENSIKSSRIARTWKRWYSTDSSVVESQNLVIPSKNGRDLIKVDPINLNNEEVEDALPIGSHPEYFDSSAGFEISKLGKTQ